MKESHEEIESVSKIYKCNFYSKSIIYYYGMTSILNIKIIIQYVDSILNIIFIFTFFEIFLKVRRS